MHSQKDYNVTWSIFGLKEPFSYAARVSTKCSIFLFIGLSAIFFIPTLTISGLENFKSERQIHITFLDDVSTTLDFLLFNPLALILFLRFFKLVDEVLSFLLSSETIMVNLPIWVCPLLWTRICLR